MKYLTLAYLKHHLNVDPQFTADDNYIESLGDAAEEVVSRYIDYPLSQLEDENRQLPKSIINAMCLWVGTAYAIRESVSGMSMSPVPTAFELLMDLWRDYTIKKDE